jgi:NADH:ubiquinone oxidoreductase subunit E
MATISVTKQSSSRQFEAVCGILQRYNYNAEKLIPILQQVQEEYRYLPERVLTFIATSLGIPPAQVFGVATFYSHFTLKPKGKYVIKICDGTACHVKGSSDLIKAMRKKIGLAEGQSTTADLLFTLETVSCIGACGLAPVVGINEEIYGAVNENKADEILEAIIKEEKEA